MTYFDVNASLQEFLDAYERHDIATMKRLTQELADHNQRLHASNRVLGAVNWTLWIAMLVTGAVFFCRDEHGLGLYMMAAACLIGGFSLWSDR